MPQRELERITAAESNYTIKTKLEVSACFVFVGKVKKNELQSRLFEVDRLY